jgi:arginase family enzyme
LFGMDLLDEITLCDAGDIFVIPSNIEKTFDQIDRVSFIHGEGAFPIIVGGDHSIGYPDVRALPHPRAARHHPLRPAHRHGRAHHGRAHAHHQLVARHRPA